MISIVFDDIAAVARAAGRRMAFAVDAHLAHRPAVNNVRRKKIFLISIFSYFSDAPRLMVRFR